LLGNSSDGSGFIGFSEEKFPGLGGRVVHAAEFIELVSSLEVFLLLGEGSELPLLLIDISVHDDTLGAGDNTVIASSDGGCCHLGDGEGNGFSLGGHEDDLLADLNV
jgi:hypothetical protein